MQIRLSVSGANLTIIIFQKGSIFKKRSLKVLALETITKCPHVRTIVEADDQRLDPEGGRGKRLAQGKDSEICVTETFKIRKTLTAYICNLKMWAYFYNPVQ